MGLFSMIGRLALDTTDFQAGVKRAESSASGMAKKVASDVKGMLTGAFTLGAITSFTKLVINAGDRIGDLAEQYHLTNEEVQRLEILAGKTGVKFEKFGESFIKFADIRQKAIDGDAKSLTLLNRYGVSQGDVVNKSKSNLDLLTQISDAYSEVSGSSQAQADALDIAGAKGQKVLSTLTQIKELGPVKLISDADIEAMGQFADSLDEIKRQAQVAAAPALGFWGRVLKRGNEMVSGGNETFALTRATLQELFDTGPTSTAALTPEDIAAGREAMSPYLPSSVAETVAKKQQADTARRSQFSRPDTGNLARIGGLYFGADYNARLIDLTAKIERHASRSADANVTTAEALKE